MRFRSRLALSVAVAALALSGAAAPAVAIEYRLLVANVFEDGFTQPLRQGELVDGASGPGLDRLKAMLDGGEFPLGALLWDRPVEPAGEVIASGYRATSVRVEFKDEPSRSRLWHEIRWTGEPGERSVWVIAPTAIRHGEIRRVALQGGEGPLRQFISYVTNGRKTPALRLPLIYLWFQEEIGIGWQKYFSRVLDLSAGIAVVHGLNDNRSMADHLRIIVHHAPAPTTYVAIVAWRPRAGTPFHDLEAPGANDLR